MGRVAALKKERAAAQPIGDKSPRHNKSLLYSKSLLYLNPLHHKSVLNSNQGYIRQSTSCRR